MKKVIKKKKKRSLGKQSNDVDRETKGKSGKRGGGGGYGV